jgi:hypothetical protein
MEERIAQWKSRGKEAFAKEDYFNAMYYYNLVSTGTHLVLVRNNHKDRTTNNSPQMPGSGFKIQCSIFLCTRTSCVMVYVDLKYP